jgi:hypothetical protein
MSQPEQYREASEDGSTGYSEFCDDDVIMAAPCNTYDTVATDGSSGATQPFAALGKRKSPEDLGVSEGPSASYKRRTITSPMDLELATPSSSAPPPEPSGDVPTSLGLGDEHDGPEPYIIVRFSVFSSRPDPSPSRVLIPRPSLAPSLTGPQRQRAKSDGRAGTPMGRPMGDRTADLPWALHMGRHFDRGA